MKVKGLIITLVVALIGIGGFLGYKYYNEKPKFELNGEKEIKLSIGKEYKEQGASATISKKDITNKIEENNNIDINKVGEYKVNYSIKVRGKKYNLERKVIIIDDIKPTITLKNKTVTIYLGNEYKEPGYKAIDNYDGDITNKVKIESNVNTNKVGNYKIVYSVTDEAGNLSTIERTVIVKKKVEKIKKGDKIVYLTFDDGPGYLTPDFLKTLDKYNVKATFFVTNQFPKFNYLIKEEAKKGHTVAVHTYTHAADWRMYNSLNTYIDDFNKMNNIIEKQTGSKSILFRFPGGSSNTVSAKKKKGVVTEIANYMEKKGYIYFDWNVSSGDAGGTTNPDRIAQNVINGVHRTGTAVVLCHDIKIGTLKALPKIIETLTKEGYEFKPLDESSPTMHQKIAN